MHCEEEELYSTYNLADKSIPVNDLGKVVKAAVIKQNMLAWQFGTVGVSDAITMGGEGMVTTHCL